MKIAVKGGASGLKTESRKAYLIYIVNISGSREMSDEGKHFTGVDQWDVCHILWYRSIIYNFWFWFIQ